MKPNTLKTGIHEALMLVPFDRDEDKLILSCIFYSFISNMGSVDSNIQNNIKSTVQSYANVFKNNFAVYKQKAIAYNIMVRKIESYRKNSFLEFNFNEIQEINKLYQNKTELVSFSTSSFSQYMYKVANIKLSNYRRLSKVHYEIMVPIIQYYKDNNGIEESNMEIYDSELYPDIPGKEIYFGIKGILPNRVVSDIKSNRIPILDKLYLVETKNPYIRIITN
jgi:hypothetical protein